MPSLDDLKKRIKSVKSTQKITKAMKMVAAAKLRKAQENAEKGRPYSKKMQNIILNLTRSISDPKNAPKLLSGTGNDKTYLCVVLTADRGLCGGFNTNICKLAKTSFKKILNEKKNLKIITVGSKGFDQIKREYGKYVVKKYSFKEKKQITFKEADTVGNEIIRLFNQNEFDKCILFFNNFKNVITQIPQAQQIIPVDKKSSESKEENFLPYVCNLKMKNLEKILLFLTILLVVFNLTQLNIYNLLDDENKIALICFILSLCALLLILILMISKRIEDKNK